jgi:hypothetical protein
MKMVSQEENLSDKWIIRLMKVVMLIDIILLFLLSYDSDSELFYVAYMNIIGILVIFFMITSFSKKTGEN